MAASSRTHTCDQNKCERIGDGWPRMQISDIIFAFVFIRFLFLIYFPVSSTTASYCRLCLRRPSAGDTKYIRTICKSTRIGKCVCIHAHAHVHTNYHQNERTKEEKKKTMRKHTGYSLALSASCMNNADQFEWHITNTEIWSCRPNESAPGLGAFDKKHLISFIIIFCLNRIRPLKTMSTNN